MGAENSAVDVIIVNYNAGEYLFACVESVLRSDIAIQVIVVDNASIDGSVDGLEARFASQTQIIKNEYNKGFAAAVNQGRACCSNAMILLLNPDCIVQPHSIGALAQVLKTSSRIAIAGGLVFNMDGTEQRGCRRREPTPQRSFYKSVSRIFPVAAGNSGSVDMTNDPIPETPIVVDAVSGAFMMIRAQAFDQLGGMDEGYFLHFEDLDICRRARDAGNEILFVPDVSIFHCQGVSSGSQQAVVEKYKHQGMRRYYQKFYKTKQPWFVNMFVAAGINMSLGLQVTMILLGKCFVYLGKLQANESDQLSAKQLVDGYGKTPADQIIVAGATSQVGGYLLPRLAAGNQQVMALSRRRQGANMQATRWRQVEYLNKASQGDLGTASVFINLAPIWTINQFESILVKMDTKKIVAMSSTSVLSKLDSTNSYERLVASKLKQGEDWLKDFCERNGVQYTIFRSTLIYSPLEKRKRQGLGFIAKFVGNCRFFPLIGEGRGKRQPVHADDLARACFTLSVESSTGGAQTDSKIYTLSGGSVISYRELITAVFQAVGVTPVFIRVSKSLVRTGIRLLSYLPPFNFLTPEMADRSEQDLCFSHEQAKQDFNYSPRRFAL